MYYRKRKTSLYSKKRKYRRIGGTRYKKRRVGKRFGDIPSGRGFAPGSSLDNWLWSRQNTVRDKKYFRTVSGQHIPKPSSTVTNVAAVKSRDLFDKQPIFDYLKNMAGSAISTAGDLALRHFVGKALRDFTSGVPARGDPDVRYQQLVNAAAEGGMDPAVAMRMANAIHRARAQQGFGVPAAPVVEEVDANNLPDNFGDLNEWLWMG